MKLNKSSQLALVAVASLAAASLLTACATITETLTVDFVFVASSKAAGANNYGQINVFEINSESGKMRQIPSSPFPSGGRDPVAEAVSSDYSSLFVANQDDNSIVQFVIGTDGKLYPFNTVNTPGIYPLALATNKTNLFVVDTYQPLAICSTADPCSGSIAVYPLTAATSSTPVQLGPNPAVNGSEEYWPLCKTGYTLSAITNTWACSLTETDIIVPTAVSLLTITSSGGTAATYAYVTAYDSSATPNAGYVFAFSVGSGGVLTPLSGSPFAAGTQPSAVASDSSNSSLYVTDYAHADVLGYSVSSTGSLVPMTSGVGGTNEFPAGNQPAAVVVDPSYPYVYVANSLDATVTAYSTSSGALTSLGTYTTDLQPVAIGVDPSTSRFLFTANYLGNDVSGFELNISAGTLLDSQFSPYAANDQPTAVAAIPHNGTGGGVEQ